MVDRPNHAEHRPRLVRYSAFPRSRAIVTAALRAGKRQAPVHGILQLDISQARRRLAAMDPPGSVTAFIVGAVARAAALHPAVHAYRDWRGRLVTPSYVDVATLVEVERPDGPVPMAHLIRDADVRSIAALSAEIRDVKANPAASQSGRMLNKAQPWLGRVPGVLTLLYRVLGTSSRARRMSGSVAVTSVGMFGGGAGAGIAQPTIQTLTILVGGISDRAVVVDGDIVVRTVMDLTISVDHKVVDGAPATRFAADLRRLIESGQW